MSISPSTDALFESFVAPPRGYGEVAFYWWLGDPLTRERLTWQLDRFEGAHMSALQINYAHSDQGGLAWGLTYASDPPLFSDAWWELLDWFIVEAEKRGLAVSLSDYTLGVPGQGWFVDEVILANPDKRGSKLVCVHFDLSPGENVTTALSDEPLCVRAYALDGTSIVPATEISLDAFVTPDRKIDWTASVRSRVVVVCRKHVEMSLDPMAEGIGEKVCEAFFEKFTRRYPDAAGRSLDFFFSDELNFGISGHLWNDAFAREFKSRKGYDVRQEMVSLFVDTGPRTPKVRLDYFDVLVTLSEQNYFKPVFDWHEKRGMTYGCDHGGRGREVMEFGDYFRTQRWNQGPGCDQPRLGADVVKNKVASSISHLYHRPRTWLEGFYSSGWGTTSAQVVDATWRNFAMGHNLLTLHGLYYSTHGGWWEWAPPCNHFRMPYWEHLKSFLAGVERLSYLLSQGTHHCDVAVMYPVELAQAAGNQKLAGVAFECAERLYGSAIDLDFIDAESLERATIEDRALSVSGESFRVLVLPAVTTLRFKSLQQAVGFAEAGGKVIVVGEWPGATERAGRDDPQVNDLVACLRTKADYVERADQVPALVRQMGTVDFECRDPSVKPYVLHRRIDARDFYFIYGVPHNTPCYFRAHGKVELWDARTGSKRAWHRHAREAAGTVIPFPCHEHEPCLIVFSPGASPGAAELTGIDDVLSIDANTKEIVATTSHTGSCSAVVEFEGKLRRLRGLAAAIPAPILIASDWEFELIPTMDNRFGDFRLPASPGLIGAEVRQFQCAHGTQDGDENAPPTDGSAWRYQTVSFGPRFWVTGPLSTNDADELEAGFVSLRRPDKATSTWRPFEVSMRFGVEGDPGRQGYHGLKGRVTDEFLTVGRRNMHDHTSPACSYEVDASSPCHFYWTAFRLGSPTRLTLRHAGLAPTRVWLDGKFATLNTSLDLPAGVHYLLLRYDAAGRNYVVVEQESDAPGFEQATPLAMSWYHNPRVVPFDARPWDDSPVEWFRCTLPPGFTSLRATMNAMAQFWLNEKPMPVREEVDALGRRYYEISTPIEPVVSRLTMRVLPVDGCFGGAVFDEPIELTCGVGRTTLGDWSEIDGLKCYSGGASYRTTVDLPSFDSETRVLIELGDVVASAEVFVNGTSLGSRVAPPWSFDASSVARAGKNEIEVRVFNTLANHYRTIPTRFGGSPRSGLFGPVTFRFERKITLRADAPTVHP